jgi:hypothetical protein
MLRLGIIVNSIVNREVQQQRYFSTCTYKSFEFRLIKGRNGAILIFGG